MTGGRGGSGAELSVNLARDRNSYLTHVISTQKDICHVHLVCVGCIGLRLTLSLG